VDFLSDFTTATHLPLPTIAVRLGVALLLGALIGIEREWRRRPAGLRTHMVTALAASVFTILTAEIIHTAALSGEGTQSDPIRVIEAVTAGVAFLAAGTIIQSRRGVKGLTTGAGMWLAGALGVAAGLGQFRVGLIAAVLGLAVIAIIGRLEAAAEGDHEKEETDKPVNER
jgi:putative Mg2+ transporter-C (MgtC) family protein